VYFVIRRNINIVITANGPCTCCHWYDVAVADNPNSTEYAHVAFCIQLEAELIAHGVLSVHVELSSLL